MEVLLYACTVYTYICIQYMYMYVCWNALQYVASCTCIFKGSYMCMSGTQLHVLHLLHLS